MSEGPHVFLAGVGYLVGETGHPYFIISLGAGKKEVSRNLAKHPPTMFVHSLHFQLRAWVARTRGQRPRTQEAWAGHSSGCDKWGVRPGPETGTLQLGQQDGVSTPVPLPSQETGASCFLTHASPPPKQMLWAITSIP